MGVIFLGGEWRGGANSNNEFSGKRRKPFILIMNDRERNARILWNTRKERKAFL